MTQFNKQAQAVIDRLNAINIDEPYWNEAEVVKAFERQYGLLGLKVPKIEVVDNMVIGYELARGAARGAAWDAAWGVAWDAARGAAWDAARDAAWDAARGAAWDAARDAARGAAWGVARDAARGAAWGVAQGAAWDAARGAAWGVARDAALLSGALNALPDDPRIGKFVEVEMEMLKALENGLDVYFPMRDKLILVPVPRMIVLGERLHYDHGKAVEWRDGSGFYFLRGVQFEEKLYNKIVNYEITPEELLTVPNADQRAAAMSMLRPDRLLKQMNARLMHTGIKGTKLYEVKNFMDTGRTEFCMWMQDSSSDREFIEWVEPKIAKQGDADLCQATAFGIPKEDYLAIEQEG